MKRIGGPESWLFDFLGSLFVKSDLETKAAIDAAFQAAEKALRLIQEEPDIAAFNAEQEYRESIQEDPMPKTFKVGDRVTKPGTITRMGVTIADVSWDASDNRCEPLFLLKLIQDERIQEDPMPSPPSLPLTPENIHELAFEIADGCIAAGGDFNLAYAAAKAVLEREANPSPKPRVFTVTIPHDATLGPAEILDCLIGTAHIATEKELITVEEVTP